MRVPPAVLLALLLAGCARPPTREDQSLRDVVQLTDGFARAGEGYFSPDGRHLVFQAEPPGEPGGYQLYVAPVLDDDGDGLLDRLGPPTRVSPRGSLNTCGYFSPDGQSLLFASTAGSPSTQPAASAPVAGFDRARRSYVWDKPRTMELYRADGWPQALAAADPARGVNLAQHKLTDNDAYDAECAFSPDGRHVVFCSNRTGDDELWVARSDGTNPVRLTFAPGYDGGPFFSPDGKKICYRSDRQQNDQLQIFVATLVRDATGDIAGLADERQLTRDAGVVNWGPFWHPTHNLIAFASSGADHRNYDVHLIRGDGTRRARVTFAEGSDVLPAFSPDGRVMVWTSRRGPGATSQLFAARFTVPDWLRGDLRYK